MKKKCMLMCKKIYNLENIKTKSKQTLPIDFKIFLYSYVITHLIPLIWDSTFLLFINAALNISLDTNFQIISVG